MRGERTSWVWTVNGGRGGGPGGAIGVIESGERTRLRRRHESPLQKLLLRCSLTPPWTAPGSTSASGGALLAAVSKRARAAMEGMREAGACTLQKGIPAMLWAGGLLAGGGGAPASETRLRWRVAVGRWSGGRRESADVTHESRCETQSGLVLRGARAHRSARGGARGPREASTVFSRAGDSH